MDVKMNLPSTFLRFPMIESVQQDEEVCGDFKYMTLGEAGESGPYLKSWLCVDGRGMVLGVDKPNEKEVTIASILRGPNLSRDAKFMLVMLANAVDHLVAEKLGYDRFD